MEVLKFDLSKQYGTFKMLNATNGVIKGMSGSPIIQDGKLIGAVTHVFVNDATKGFGIYIDWMIEQ